MSLYIKLSCEALTDPKIFAVGPEAFSLWVKGLLYAKQHLTDGIVHKEILPLIGIGIPNINECIEKLVASGLWQTCSEGYCIGSEKWARHQTTKEQVESQRNNAKERQAKSRASRISHKHVTRDTENMSQARHKKVRLPEPEPEPEIIKQEVNPILVGTEPTKHKERLEHFPKIWEAFESSYPPRNGDLGKAKAKEKLKSLIASGKSPAQILDGVKRYRAWCDANGKTKSEFVVMMPTWLNQSRWCESYEIHTNGHSKTSEIPLSTAQTLETVR